MNIWSLVLAIGLLVTVLLLPCDSRKEYFVPPKMNYGQQALLEVSSKNVKVPKNSIDRVAFTKVRMVPRQKGLLDFSSNQTLLFTGNPKYISSKANTVIVGKRIQFEATGKSPQGAMAAANKRAESVLSEIRNTLQTGGLMSAPS